MGNVILKVEHISKQYRLGLVGTGTLKDDLKRFWYQIRGKEDPFLMIGAENLRTQKTTEDYVWALKDINFEVREGEVLGIIGKNGAGKSTLLKLLSQVTSPTTGTIKSRGRIASLLEVGTGFHPELTGRENIYLNGAILGMTKAEISSKIDEIIDFSGCEMYIDTPTKRYSSGMTVRLAFAVAAHLEPDILVIDEVLAVGDAEFQKKAIGKMQDISTGQGRTVLFVSHNMAAVKSLCTRAIVLQNGSVVFKGNTDDAVDFYLKNDLENKTAFHLNQSPKKDSDILEVSVKNKSMEISPSFSFDEQIILHIKFFADNKAFKSALLTFRVFDQNERVIFSSIKKIKHILDKDKHVGEVKVGFPQGVLVPNDYRVTIGLHIPNQEIINVLENVVSFTIEETGSGMEIFKGGDYGCVILPCVWEKILS